MIAAYLIEICDIYMGIHRPGSFRPVVYPRSFALTSNAGYNANFNHLSRLNAVE